MNKKKSEIERGIKKVKNFKNNPQKQENKNIKHPKT